MKLNREQRRAAEYTGAAPLLVAAGAGCGKTRTIIARAAHLIRSGVPAAEILLLAFTNKAAHEMRQRLRDEVGEVHNLVQVSTFHSWCHHVLRRSGYREQILDPDDQTALMGFVRGRYDDPDLPRSAKLVHHYSFLRNSCLCPDEYTVSRRLPSVCGDIFGQYQQEKEKQGYCDYDDLLELYADRFPEFRPVIRHVLVDEFQDSNPLQYRILQRFHKAGVHLYCVGDPAQSVYGFRGASFEQTYFFRDVFGGEVLPLTLNYRGLQPSLDCSSALLAASDLDYGSGLRAHRGGGEPPMYAHFENVYSESIWTADHIRDLLAGGTSPGEILVLFRAAYQARHLEAQLLRRRVPYVLIGGTGLAGTAHVRDLLALLRCCFHTGDYLAMMRFLQLFPRIGEVTARKITDAGIRSLNPDHPALRVYRAVDLSDPVKTGLKALEPYLKRRYRQDWNKRRSDFDVLDEIASGSPDLGTFLDSFALDILPEEEQSGRVILSTVHSAKGTEAEHCFVAASGFPSNRASESDLEEERRIFYVALTRARDCLYITVTDTTVFLDQIPAGLYRYCHNGWTDLAEVV